MQVYMYIANVDHGLDGQILFIELQYVLLHYPETEYITFFFCVFCISNIIVVP